MGVTPILLKRIFTHGMHVTYGHKLITICVSIFTVHIDLFIKLFTIMQLKIQYSSKMDPENV